MMSGAQDLRMSPLRKRKLYQVHLSMAKNLQQQLCHQEEQLLKEWRDLNGLVIDLTCIPMWGSSEERRRKE